MYARLVGRETRRWCCFFWTKRIIINNTTCVLLVKPLLLMLLLFDAMLGALLRTLKKKSERGRGWGSAREGCDVVMAVGQCSAGPGVRRLGEATACDPCCGRCDFDGGWALRVFVLSFLLRCGTPLYGCFVLVALLATM